MQPVHGGPTYILRNVFYNVRLEAYKMHNGPSGAVMLHNTFQGKALRELEEYEEGA